jgi:hypothetical protein
VLRDADRSFLDFDGHRNHHDLRTDEAGRFAIVVAPEPPTEPGVDWLRTSPDVNEVYARAYHLDPARDRPAEYRIEPLDPVGPGGADGEDVAARLRQMAEVVRDVTAAMPQSLGDPNVMGDLWRPDPDGPSRMWSALDNVYSRGVFRLEPHQALLVEGVVVPCDYSPEAAAKARSSSGGCARARCRHHRRAGSWNSTTSRTSRSPRPSHPRTPERRAAGGCWTRGAQNRNVFQSPALPPAPGALPCPPRSPST